MLPWHASDLFQVIEADARLFFDEDMGPKVLDEGFREKISAHLLIVFSEDLHETFSLGCILIW